MGIVRLVSFRSKLFIPYIHAFCLAAGPVRTAEIIARFIVEAEDEKQVRAFKIPPTSFNLCHFLKFRCIGFLLNCILKVKSSVLVLAHVKPSTYFSSSPQMRESQAASEAGDSRKKSF